MNGDIDLDLEGQIVYLLCIDGVAHYIGSTTNLARRIEEHRRGGTTAILDAYRARNHGFTVARAWSLWSIDAMYDAERWLKEQRGASVYCPLCSESPRNIWPENFVGARERYASVLERRGRIVHLYKQLIGQGYQRGEANRLARQMVMEGGA